MGLYAVLAYSVRQRAAEVGLRVALGANRSSIAKLVIGFGMRLVAIGAALGVLGAVAAVGFVRSQLFGVAPSDPAAWIGVAVLLMAVGAISCAVPVWRAVARSTGRRASQPLIPGGSVSRRAHAEHGRISVS